MGGGQPDPSWQRKELGWSGWNCGGLAQCSVECRLWADSESFSKRDRRGCWGKAPTDAVVRNTIGGAYL